MENLKFEKGRFFVILILVLIGIGLCLDLSYIFYKTNFLEGAARSFCSVSELIDCDGVAKTSFSMTFGVPNALWGLFVYGIVLFLLFVDRIQVKFKNTIFDVFKNPRSYIAALEVLQFLLSMILAAISIFKLNKICVLCFATYFVDLFIAIAATNGIFKDIKTTVVDFIAGVKKYTVLFIVVLIAFVSLLVYLNDSLIMSPKLKNEKMQKEFYEAKSNKYAIKGNVLGNQDSKVKVKVYTDFNCPYCKVLNIMLHKLAKDEDVLIEEVNFPLDKECNGLMKGGTLGGHETSCAYARYALAARKQDSFWGVADILYYKSPINEAELFAEIKKANLNINIEQLKNDANSIEIRNELSKDIDSTVSRGLNATPAFDINGLLYVGVIPYKDMVDKIHEAQVREAN